MCRKKNQRALFLPPRSDDQTTTLGLWSSTSDPLEAAYEPANLHVSRDVMSITTLDR